MKRTFPLSFKSLRGKAGEAGNSAQRLAPKLFRKKGNQPRSRWQWYIWLALSGYRLLAFAIAAIVMFTLPSVFQVSVLPPHILVTCVGIYSLFKALQPLRWYQGGILSLSALGIDIAICIFLVMSTGGLYSPFLLYTLAPVLIAAISLDNKVTFGIAGLSVAYVIGIQLYNPFFPTQFSFSELGYFLVYLAAICLASVLPYLTNINLRQRLQAQDILQERQRLSREIHDGIAQTLCGLRWQVQLLHQRLTEMGIDLDEVKELEKLTERAHQDTRESLELLHNYNSDGDFYSHLKEYVEHLKQDTKIDFQLDIQAAELDMPSLVELQLLRICQEALTNIKRHSAARNVSIKLKPVNKHLEMSIADDGYGFDGVAYHDKRQVRGYGLTIMKERADSIGGQFKVLSVPGKGTEIQVEVPLTPHKGSL